MSISPMDRETRAVLKKIEFLEKTTFSAISETDPALKHVSKFCGVPLLKQDEAWPTCQCCKDPMQLYLQLDSESLPTEYDSPYQGILQVFFCTDDECDNDSYDHYGNGQLVRILSFSEAVSYPSNVLKNDFGEHFITDWNPSKDLPDYQDVEDTDNYPEGEEPVELSDEEFDTLCESDYPVTGNKLGGWPVWVQGPEYAACPEHGIMEIVFQLDSETKPDFMLGDAGVMHVHVCRTCQKATSGWACC